MKSADPQEPALHIHSYIKDIDYYHHPIVNNYH